MSAMPFIEKGKIKMDKVNNNDLDFLHKRVEILCGQLDAALKVAAELEWELQIMKIKYHKKSSKEKEIKMNEKQIEAIKKAYPVGIGIYIDYISDNSYPKAVGQYGHVVSVDDIGQVHCRMDNGTTATVCKEYGDVFFRVGTIVENKFYTESGNEYDL